MTEMTLLAARAATREPTPQTPVIPTVTWYLCDLLTGLILTELPLSADVVRRTIAQVNQQTFTLAPADKTCPDDWAQLLTPGKTMIVLTLDDDPVQGWWITEAPIGGVTVTITASTLEHCLERTNVPDIDTTIDDAEAAMLLCAELVPRFGFTLTHTPTGHVADQLYHVDEDLSVLAAMQQMMAGDPGVEWRITLSRNPDKTHFVKTLEARPRVGMDRPDAVFDLSTKGRGCVESYLRTTSYALGKGATMLIGTSEGSGSSRPITPPQYSVLVAQGWPVVEERINFTGLDAGSVGDEDTALLAKTRDTLSRRGLGTVTWSIVGSDAAPRPGRDYAEGDTVRIDIAPQGKQDPVGGVLSPRVLGWEINPDTGQVTPILWDDSTVDGDGA